MRTVMSLWRKIHTTQKSSSELRHSVENFHPKALPERKKGTCQWSDLANIDLTPLPFKTIKRTMSRVTKKCGALQVNPIWKKGSASCGWLFIQMLDPKFLHRKIISIRKSLQINAKERKIIWQKRCCTVSHDGIVLQKGYDYVQPFELPINKPFKNHVRTSFLKAPEGNFGSLYKE